MFHLQLVNVNGLLKVLDKYGNVLHNCIIVSLPLEFSIVSFENENWFFDSQVTSVSSYQGDGTTFLKYASFQSFSLFFLRSFSSDTGACTSQVDTHNDSVERLEYGRTMKETLQEYITSTEKQAEDSSIRHTAFRNNLCKMALDEYRQLLRECKEMQDVNCDILFEYVCCLQRFQLR